MFYATRTSLVPSPLPTAQADTNGLQSQLEPDCSGTEVGSIFATLLHALFTWLHEEPALSFRLGNA